MKQLIEKLGKFKWAFILALIAAYAALPHFLSKYFVLCMDIGMVGGLVILGLVILVGYTGQLSLGQIAYFAIGAYAVAILNITYGVNIWLCVLISGFVGCIFGLLVGIPAFQLRGPFLAIITIAFFEIMNILLINLQDFTGGPYGMSGISKLMIGEWNLSKNIEFFYLMLAILIIMILFTLRLKNSRIGRGMIAVKTDETAAPMLGVNVKGMKRLSFAISAFMAAFGGGLYATFVGYVVPEAFSYSSSSEYLLVSVISGFQAIFAPILGVFIYILPEFFREIQEYYLMIFSALLLIIVVVSAWRNYKVENEK